MRPKHSTTFEVGDEVQFYEDTFPMYQVYVGKRFTILETQDVPPEEIDFNPATGGGGVAHHQLVVIELDGEQKMMSGAFFEKVS